MAAQHGSGDAAPRVADPEEYNQTARLRAINQARERVANTIEQSMARFVTDSEFDDEDRQQVIRATMYSYLTNIEWLMVESDETELLREHPLGEVVIEPPDRFVQLVHGPDNEYPRVIGNPDISSFSKTIYGIQDYLSAPDIFEKTWTIQVEHRHDKPESLQETRRTYMPAHISKNAFRIANKFLNQAGIDVDLHENEGDAGFDYSDILDQGPPDKGLPPQLQNDGGGGDG